MEVSPDIAKNMILRRILAPMVEQGFENDEEQDVQATWMRLTLTIFNAHKSGSAVFDIGNAYCSSIFSPFQFP